MGKRKEHKIGDMLAVTDDGIVYTVGWVTQINEHQNYTVQWSDDSEEYPMQYNFNDIQNFREWYNTLVTKVDSGATTLQCVQRY